MHESVWTPTVKNGLRRLFAEGLSASEMATAIGCEFGIVITRNSVISQCHRLALSRPKPPPRPKLVPRSLGARAAPPPRPVVLEERPLHLLFGELDAGDGRCRWPYGDRQFTFCGQPALDDSPYCGCHALKARGSGTTSERAASSVLL